MLHYHQNGVTLTLNFSASEISFFQEGVAGLLMHLSETAQGNPVREEMLFTIARIMGASVLTESQQLNMSKGLLKIGKLPENGPVDSPKAA